MKLIKKGKIDGIECKVVKAHTYADPTAKGDDSRRARVVEVGETVYYKEPDLTGMVQTGRVIPVDMPEVGEYIVIREFNLQRDGQIFKADLLETIEMLADDALRHMLLGDVIPADDSLWRPFNRRLKTTQKKTTIPRDTRPVGIFDDMKGRQ